jgi:proteasome lid subunit RPN8/RPN11
MQPLRPSPPSVLLITERDYLLMLAYLEETYPLEGCGLMAGEADSVRRLYPVDNQLASSSAYEMDPKQQLEAMLNLEEQGWELLAIYHSHPHGPATPSATDVAKAYYPESLHVIVSFFDRQQPSVRAFSIQENGFIEVGIEIV